jgi:hypothetical protein
MAKLPENSSCHNLMNKKTSNPSNHRSCFALFLYSEADFLPCRQ